MTNDKMRQVCQNIAQSQRDLSERQKELDRFMDEMNIFLSDFTKENNSLWTMKMEIRDGRTCFNMRKTVDRGWFRAVLVIEGENVRAIEHDIHGMGRLGREAEDLLGRALKQGVELGSSWDSANRVLESWLEVGDSEEPW